MSKKNKILIIGIILFAIPLAVQAYNIYLALTTSPASDNREMVGMTIYWSQLLVFPQLIGIALFMYAMWGNKPKT